MVSDVSTERNTVLDHLKHSFTEGDANFDAQFWYARELFLRGDYDGAMKMFRTLKGSPLPSDSRNWVRGIIVADDGSPLRFSGMVVRKEETYMLIKCDRFGSAIFGYINDNPDQWAAIGRGCNVETAIGFCMHGARALDARIL
jgi:hypothetical protein